MRITKEQLIAIIPFIIALIIALRLFPVALDSFLKQAESCHNCTLIN